MRVGWQQEFNMTPAGVEGNITVLDIVLNARDLATLSVRAVAVRPLDLEVV